MRLLAAVAMLAALMSGGSSPATSPAYPREHVYPSCEGIAHVPGYDSCRAPGKHHNH